MLKLRKKRRDKIGITYFGLHGHEVALLENMMASVPDMAADYEIRDPNEAGTCNIVVVNRDSKLATSWWKNLQKRNPAAAPMFLTDTKQTPDDTAYCKRPFSPSFLQSAFQDFLSKNNPLA